MKLLIIRHAIAEERDDFARTGRDDRLRPLTDAGRKKMKQAARGLRTLAPDIDLLATSPLTRAAQTGAILDTVYDGLDEVEIEELAPAASPIEFLSWLRRQDGKDCVAVVGHEPSLSLILAWLLTGSERRLFAFRKGGACLLQFSDEPAAGTATLLWALTPAQLRALGEAAK
jgi:phosphohistidine phosphatase